MSQAPPDRRAAKPLAYDAHDLEQFVEGYVGCLLFFETLPPADESEGEEWWDGDSYEEAGFGIGCLTPASMERVRKHFARFLDLGARLIPGNRVWFEGTEMSHAGHDAAMSCQGFEEGFAAGRWKPEAGRRLLAIAEQVGGLDIEPSGGKVHVR